jgi:hypothetical protein
MYLAVFLPISGVFLNPSSLGLLLGSAIVGIAGYFLFLPLPFASPLAIFSTTVCLVRLIFDSYQNKA